MMLTIKHQRNSSVRVFTTIIVVVQATVSLNATALNEEEVRSLALAPSTCWMVDGSWTVQD